MRLKGRLNSRAVGLKGPWIRCSTASRASAGVARRRRGLGGQRLVDEKWLRRQHEEVVQIDFSQLKALLLDITYVGRILHPFQVTSYNLGSIISQPGCYLCLRYAIYLLHTHAHRTPISILYTVSHRSVCNCRSRTAWARNHGSPTPHAGASAPGEVRRSAGAGARGLPPARLSGAAAHAAACGLRARSRRAGAHGGAQRGAGARAAHRADLAAAGQEHTAAAQFRGRPRLLAKRLCALAARPGG